MLSAPSHGKSLAIYIVINNKGSLSPSLGAASSLTVDCRSLSCKGVQGSEKRPGVDFIFFKANDFAASLTGRVTAL